MPDDAHDEKLEKKNEATPFKESNDQADQNAASSWNESGTKSKFDFDLSAISPASGFNLTDQKKFVRNQGSSDSARTVDASHTNDKSDQNLASNHLTVSTLRHLMPKRHVSSLSKDPLDVLEEEDHEQVAENVSNETNGHELAQAYLNNSQSVRQELSEDKVPESCKGKDREICQSPTFGMIQQKDGGQESKDNSRKGIFSTNTYFGNDLALKD